MSNGYAQPYESLNSTAKIIKLPNRRERSKSAGRDFFSRILSKSQLSQNTFSDGEPRHRKCDSSSPTVRQHQNLSSEINVQGNKKFSPKPLTRSSRSNSRSSQEDNPTPTPRTSISRGSLTESENSSIVTSKGNSIIIGKNPNLKTRTTVTVHLSKSNKTSSSPNLLETSLNDDIFNSTNNTTNESLSQSMTSVRIPTALEINRNNTKNISSKRSQTHLNYSSFENNRTNVKNFVAVENSRTNGSNFIISDNSVKGRNFDTRNSQANDKNFKPVNGQATPFLLCRELSSSSLKSNLEEEEKPELNSWQVFRQPKYKNRDKSLRRIKQLEHLSKNESCNEVVNQLAQGIQPNTYENQHSLKLVEFINQEGFVTTSKNIFPVAKHFSKKPAQPPIHKRPNQTPNNFNRVQRDHIYSEIREAEHNQSGELHTPTFQKKVTFRTFHEPIQEGDPFSHNKKILPAKLWGIVEVIQALRSRTDEDRRKIANLCYQAILTGSNHSSKFFGKVDNSRWGELAYILLMDGSFEVRDSEGFLMARHAFTDVSVIYQPEEDPNIFVYIGRCKFNGRIGMAVRLNKPKYTVSIVNAFKNNK